MKKNADGSRDVFVCWLSEGNPISGAAVHILGTNGLPVAEAVTDAGGRAAVPSASGLNREKRPVAATVSVKRGADEDAAWLPLDDHSRVVDYSRFPTQGQTSNADGINAYVFSERGIFRPGETLRFGMLMRRGDWKALPPDMPFFAELSDPSERTNPAAAIRRRGRRPCRAEPDRPREARPRGRGTFASTCRPPMPTALRSCSVPGPCGWRNSSPTP